MTDDPSPSAGATAGDGPDLLAAKADLRRRMREARSRAAEADPDAFARLTANLTASLAPGPGAVVSAYWPMRGEIDPRPALAALAVRGCRTALPVMQGPAMPLDFKAWELGDPLVDADFGVKEPEPEAESVSPDLLLVPMLAFDRRGMRLGYGGGFYDRTLAQLRGLHAVQAIGIAYAAQEVENVPAGPYDVALDGICTEAEFIEIHADLNGG